MEPFDGEALESENNVDAVHEARTIEKGLKHPVFGSPEFVKKIKDAIQEASSQGPEEAEPASAGGGPFAGWRVAAGMGSVALMCAAIVVPFFYMKGQIKAQTIIHNEVGARLADVSRQLMKTAESSQEKIAETKAGKMHL